MPDKMTSDFTGKSPAQTASIMKAEAGGVKRNAETRIWPQIEKARDAEDKVTIAYWVEVINCLHEGSEEPKVPDVDAFNAPAPSKPELTIV